METGSSFSNGSANTGAATEDRRRSGWTNPQGTAQTLKSMNERNEEFWNARKPPAPTKK